MAIDLTKAAKDHGLKYFLISYVDLFGGLRAKLVPAQAIGEMQKAGAGFAGFATWLDVTPADADMMAVPDPASLTMMPWRPEVGWLAADLYIGGKPVEHGPRWVLKRQIEKAAALGMRMKTGVECEFFLVKRDGKSIADEFDDQEKPCYDQSALMRSYDIIREICDGMIANGWNPYQNDHEDANGQFEMNWTYDDALVTADRHVFFKFMAKAVAEKHGLRATFMPKPFLNLTGNGCHAHVSVWDAKGAKNLFHDAKGELGLSKMAYQFMAGVINSAPALSAILNPTVNSYKRINAPVTVSGSTWSPNAVSYGGNNRSHMIRIPDPGRFELRLPDGAVNPYLLQAAILFAGLDGVTGKRDPGERLDINMYTDGHKLRSVKRLPENLHEALKLFGKDKAIAAGMGENFAQAYVKLKTAEWRSYCQHLSTWETAHTLDI